MVMGIPNGWYAEVTPTRFGYDIALSDATMEVARRWWRPTRASAERAGRRLAARKNAQEARMRRRWRVEP